MNNENQQMQENLNNIEHNLPEKYQEEGMSENNHNNNNIEMIRGSSENEDNRREENIDDHNSIQNQQTPSCEGEFQFTHRLADKGEIVGIFMGPGAHVAPHDHMAYVGGRSTGSDEMIMGQKNSQQIQIYAPVDIYRFDLRKHERIGEQGNTYVEWGAYFYTCDENQLMFGHVTDPSDIFFENADLNCENKYVEDCTLEGNLFIPAGTPILVSSGYAAGFDFGVCLPAASEEELDRYESNGYSINPWRSSSGKCICPYDLYQGDLREEYVKLFGEYSCGPFNQDVPGTAKGLWFPTPSEKPDTDDPWFREDVDEQQVVWLYTEFRGENQEEMTVGSNTNFGLDYYQYGFEAKSSGNINRKWDNVVPGETYCFELKQQISASELEPRVAKVMIAKVSENKLTLEAFDSTKCNGQTFTNNKKVFYR